MAAAADCDSAPPGDEASACASAEVYWLRRQVERGLGVVELRARGRASGKQLLLALVGELGLVEARAGLRQALVRDLGGYAVDLVSLGPGPRQRGLRLRDCGASLCWIDLYQQLSLVDVVALFDRDLLDAARHERGERDLRGRKYAAARDHGLHQRVLLQPDHLDAASHNSRNDRESEPAHNREAEQQPAVMVLEPAHRLASSWSPCSSRFEVRLTSKAP